MSVPGIVQSTTINYGPGVTSSFTSNNFTSAQTAGGCIIVFIGCADTSTAVLGTTAVTDNSGNAYTRAGFSAPVPGSKYGSWIYVCNSILSAPANTNYVIVTLASGAIDYPEVYALEIGGQTASPVDAATVLFATGSSGTASVGPVTTGAQYDMMLAYCNSGPGGNSIAWQADSNSPTSFSSWVQWENVASAGGTATATTNLNSSGFWVQSVIGLKGIVPPSAPGIVQSTTANYGAGVTGSFTSNNFTSTQAIGDCIVVFIGCDDTSPSAVLGAGSVTDHTGNIYTLVDHVVPSGGVMGCWIYVSKVIGAALANTNFITVTLTSGTIDYPEIYALEVSGQSANPVDSNTTSIAAGSSGFTASVGPVTTAAAGYELLLAYCVSEPGASGTDSGWLDDVNSPTTFYSWVQWRNLPSVGGTATASTFLHSSGLWNQSVIGLIPSQYVLKLLPTDAIFFGMT